MVNSNEQLYLKGQDLYKNHGTFVNADELDNKREKSFFVLIVESDHIDTQ